MGKKSGGAGLRRLLDSTPSPVYAVDAKRRLVYCNPAFQSWTGHTLDDLADVRIDYHSSEDEPLRKLGNSLCPPPSVFAGEPRTGTIVLMSSDGALDERAAHFTPLCGFLTPTPPAEAVGVLVLVASGSRIDQDTATEEPESLHADLARVRQRDRTAHAFDRLLGTSPSIQRVRRQVSLAVKSSANVAVVGPPGSGREHVARTIYYGGRDQSGMLVPLSCELLDAELLASTLSVLAQEARELDGERPGALLLLEADQLSADCQKQLADWLGDTGDAIRIIASSRTPLHEATGNFRTDLAFAISTLEIRLPPLHERVADIPLLAQAFLEESNRLGGSQRGGFAEEALDRLVGHTYRENVDELRAIVQQACANAQGPLVTSADLPPSIGWALDRDAHPKHVLDAIELDDFLQEVEAELIQRALSASKGNRTQAAKLLGVSRGRLLRKLGGDSSTGDAEGGA